MLEGLHPEQLAFLFSILAPPRFAADLTSYGALEPEKSAANDQS